MTYQELRGRSAIVTGAGSNLGRAIAIALSEQGVSVAICDINEDAANETHALISEAGGRAIALQGNTSNSADVRMVVEETKKEFARIDILVNCAGVTQVGKQSLVDVSEELFDKIIAVNLKGYWLTMKYALPLMIEGGGGCVVNIASIMALVSNKGVGVYAASKHAVLGLTRTAALEYGETGVRVNAVCPGRQEGAMQSPVAWGFSDDELARQAREMNPATGRLGRAAEVASTVLFLCSDGASNIHGAAIPVDGGYTAR